jgi:hypothetical protein
MLGASARRTLRALADGETNPETLAALADQHLRVLNAGRDKARRSGISSERVSSISCFKRALSANLYEKLVTDYTCHGLMCKKPSLLGKRPSDTVLTTEDLSGVSG